MSLLFDKYLTERERERERESDRGRGRDGGRYTECCLFHFNCIFAVMWVSVFCVSSSPCLGLSVIRDCSISWSVEFPFFFH